MKRKDNSKRLWQIICTEEKMRLIARCVEDVNRFIAGQQDMMSCIDMFENMHEINDIFMNTVKPLMNPELARNESYGWTGGNCPNEYQRKQIAQGYATYKSILSALANEYQWDNVHSGQPLTCEDGGELMRVRPLPADSDEYTDMWLCCDKENNYTLHRSKPLWRKWANCEGWSSEGWYIAPEAANIIKQVFKLPDMTWQDEPIRVTLTWEHKKIDDKEISK